MSEMVNVIVKKETWKSWYRTAVRNNDLKALKPKMLLLMKKRQLLKFLQAGIKKSSLRELLEMYLGQMKETRHIVDLLRVWSSMVLSKLRV